MNLLVYVIPAVLMILATQLTRKMFTKYDGSQSICNGTRWVLILVALTPIVNIIALVVECSIIACNIAEDEYDIKDEYYKLVKWWRK